MESLRLKEIILEIVSTFLHSYDSIALKGGYLYCVPCLDGGRLFISSQDEGKYSHRDCKNLYITFLRFHYAEGRFLKFLWCNSLKAAISVWIGGGRFFLQRAGVRKENIYYRVQWTLVGNRQSGDYSCTRAIYKGMA